MTLQGEMKALVSLLSDEDDSIVTQVTQKIRSIGPSVLPYLEKAWKADQRHSVRQRIEPLIQTLHYEQIRKRLQVWSVSDSHDLMTGMWIVATYLYPHTTLAQLRRHTEKIADHIVTKRFNDRAPVEQVKALNRIFFDTLKFRAGGKDFFSPGNALLNVALKTRKGNPVTLGVIYLLMAQRLRMPVYGVNLPNLFLLTYKTKEYPQFYINTFNRGIILSRRDVENYIAELQLTHQKEFFEPCSHVAIVRRALCNLMFSFEKTGQRHRADEVKKLLEDVVEPT